MLRFIFVFMLVLALNDVGMTSALAASNAPLPTSSASVPKAPVIKNEAAPVAVSKIEGVKTDTPKTEGSSGEVSGDDPYTVRGVKVDVSAENSLKARDKAFTQGQQLAFDILAKNLSGDENTKKYDEDQIAKLVKSFEVESERASGTRYTATLTYHFKPQATAALLGKNGVEVSDDPYNKPKKTIPNENPLQPVAVNRALVLPISRANDKSVLWEESTSWRRAWDNVLSDHPNPELVLPEGNIEDVGSITASEALAGLNLPLQRIMRKYQAKEVLVAVLMSNDKAPQPNQNLSIQLARFDSNGKMLRTTTLPFPAQPARKEMEWLQASVMNTIAAWQDERARSAPPQMMVAGGTLSQPATANTPQVAGQYLRVPLTVPFANMEEWAAKRQVLESIPGMAALVVQRMNRYRAIVQIDYTGAQTQLDQALSTRNMQILPTNPPDGTYMLSSTGQPPLGYTGGQGQPVFTTVYPAPTPQPVQIQQPQIQPAQIQPIGQPELLDDPRYQNEEQQQ